MKTTYKNIYLANKECIVSQGCILILPVECCWIGSLKMRRSEFYCISHKTEIASSIEQEPNVASIIPTDDLSKLDVYQFPRWLPNEDAD